MLWPNWRVSNLLVSSLNTLERERVWELLCCSLYAQPPRVSATLSNSRSAVDGSPSIVVRVYFETCRRTSLTGCTRLCPCWILKIHFLLLGNWDSPTWPCFYSNLFSFSSFFFAGSSLDASNALVEWYSNIVGYVTGSVLRLAADIGSQPKLNMHEGDQNSSAGAVSLADALLDQVTTMSRTRNKMYIKHHLYGLSSLSIIWIFPQRACRFYYYFFTAHHKSALIVFPGAIDSLLYIYTLIIKI